MGKLTKSITKSEFINMIGMDTYIHSFKTQIWNVGLVEVSSCSNSKYYNVTIFGVPKNGHHFLSGIKSIISFGSTPRAVQIAPITSVVISLSFASLYI